MSFHYLDNIMVTNWVEKIMKTLIRYWCSRKEINPIKVQKLATSITLLGVQWPVGP